MEQTAPNPKTLEAIRKKLVGKNLTYEEIYSIIDDISKNRLSDILTTYFTAAGFSRGFNREEIYYMTKSMAETGEVLNLPGIVVDKHGIGGIPGNRSTMILVPIMVAAGLTIPKTSSRAITSPAGTADTMEVLCKVNFSSQEIREIIKDVGGCIVWGGGLDLAPADDKIIRVERPLAFESFDKVLVSIMAKKIAESVNHLVIDVPVSPTGKVRHLSDAHKLGDKFSFLAKRFGIKVAVSVNETLSPIGFGVGPKLEARDVLAVLEQKEDRAKDLEDRALKLCSILFQLSGKSHSYAEGLAKAKEILTSGKAMSAMKTIIKRQEGDEKITSETITLGKETVSFKSEKSGKVKSINNFEITAVSRVLGCPSDKEAGLFVNKKTGDCVDKGEAIYTIYSSDRERLAKAVEYIHLRSIIEIG